MSDGFRGPDDDKVPAWLQDRRKEQNHGHDLPTPSRDQGEYDERLLLADVAFNRHSMNDGHHVSPTDNGMVQIGTDRIEVVLAQKIDEEAFKRTLTAATRATIGLDLSQTLPGDWEHCQAFCDWYKNRVRLGLDVQAYRIPPSLCDHEQHEYKETYNERPHYRGKVPYPDWEEMLKGGLQTALETQTIVFAVSGASRTCTHQLVRSRRAGFHQQSQRASYMGDMPECRMPESVWRNGRARRAFLNSVLTAWRAYRTICEEDISYQDARFVLPEGSTNFILLEYPVREFINVFAYRGCSMFQWEIVEVMRKCRDVLIAEHPWLEPYVKISCEKIERCTFQGWESPEGQCDFPWAKDELRTFKPEFHTISRRTGKEGV